jgi:hypothetical protein
MAKRASGTSARKRLLLIVAGLAVLVFPALTATAEDPGPAPSTETERVRDALEDVIEDTLGDLLLGRIGRPALVSPTEGATVSSDSSRVAFEWQPAKRARTYEVQIDCWGCETPGQWSIEARGRPWMTVPGLETTSYDMTMPAMTGAFRWRVRGLRDSRGGDWSAWTNFSVTSAYAIQPTVPPGGTPYTGVAPDAGAEPGPGAVDVSSLAVTGRWTSNSGRSYDLAQAGPRFIWSTPDGTETGSAILGMDGRIQVEQWTGAASPVPYQGRIAQTDELGRATIIDWGNNLVFSRQTGGEHVQPPVSVPVVPAGQGYCCLNGTVYQARDVDCANYGGLFFQDLQAARQACNQ